MRRWCLLLLPLFAAVQGCLSSAEVVRSMRGVIPLSRDIEVTRAEIRSRVLVGTPIEEAKRLLESHDFSIDELMRLGRRDDSAPPDRQEFVFRRPLPMRRWDDFYPGLIWVYLLHDGCRVTDVIVEMRQG